MGDLLDRVFGVHDDYLRPRPTRWWGVDAAIALLLTLITASMVMANRAVPELTEYLPLAPSMLAIGSAGVLLVARRRFPIATMLALTGVHFIVTGVALPLVSSLASMQITYFLGIYTAVAYARRRPRLATAVIVVYVAMALWLILFDVYGRSFMPDDFQPTPWYYVATIATNIAYFGGATWMGRNAWLRAKATDELAASTETVQRQAGQLAEQAVVSERLRIARDLHDSVAHHISLIGVQTAAARRAMAAKPEDATDALLAVEGMSRSAVADLRSLVGSLRDAESPDDSDRSLQSVESMARQAGGDDLAVEYAFVGDEADQQHLTPVQSATLARVTQEALTNARKHSTATRARVVLRITPTVAEVEVTDDGRPRPNSSGSGLGHVGMRERVTALGGTVDVGPRSSQGYRVFARLPRTSS